MKSIIRVKYDFDKKEPYIQMYLEKDLEQHPDLRDEMLKAFVEEANYKGLRIWYPETCNDNSVPQIRLGSGDERPEDRQFD